MPTQSLFDRVMRQEDDPKVRERILEIVNETGVRENDPLFVVMLATGRMQALLERSPRELRQTFEYAHQQIFAKLEDYEQAARRGVEHQVAQMVNAASKSGGGTPAKLPSWLGVAGGVSALVIGFLGGLG